MTEVETISNARLRGQVVLLQMLVTKLLAAASPNVSDHILAIGRQYAESMKEEAANSSELALAGGFFSAVNTMDQEVFGARQVMQDLGLIPDQDPIV